MATEPTVDQLRVAASVLPPFAILVTYFRLYLRKSQKKLWWDDLWAFVSTLFAVMWVASIILHIDPNATTASRSAKITVYYFCAQTFYATAWTARISILFTVIRLSFGTQRRVLSIVAISFFVAWAVLFSQIWWVCEGDPAWKNLALPQCILGRNVAIAQIICDVTSDAILIGAPVRLLLGSQIHRSLKLRLIAVFAATATTTGVSLYHVYCFLRLGGVPEAFAANLQISISLLVANLSVIVAFLFRLTSDGADDTENQTPLGLTTFGASAGSRRRVKATTVTGIETMAEDPQMMVRVDISQINDGKSREWNELDTFPMKAAAV
ncbi:hypothetical protein FB45DRAFT_823211 [Roridomyces roridus]|uniref:Rhodopsin domain-containing protein n=1 Tax=Roridomyces roridus TaxID=1738132 RepID=A0AAD7CGN7_9AGAR|nr:hypothetical protein FB45DRAFT_823211 [Roridomyces roridus]